MTDFTQLDDINGIEVEILGKDYIPFHNANYNLLAGNGGTGKSMIALKMISHYLMEKPKKKVLGIFSEDTKHEISKRLDNITKSLAIGTQEVKDRTFFKTVDNDDDNVFCRKEGRMIVDTNYLSDFKKNLIKYDVGMVVLDPLERFHTGLSENDESDMKYFMMLLMKIGIDCNVAVLVLHHTSKGDKSGFRGSSVIANKGRVSYNIRKNYIHDKQIGVDVIREGWEKSVVLSTIKDNYYIARYCDSIQKDNGKLDLPVEREVETRYEDKNGRATSAPKPVMEVEYVPDEECSLARPSVTISVANHNNAKNAKGFDKKIVAWDELLDVMTCGVAYSPSTFENGHRHKNNFQGGNDVLFLDIDDGMTLETAKEVFKDLQAILVTTKSHQVEKNGIVCDRYRVVLKLDKPMNLDAVEYSYAMQAIFAYFGSVADTACSDPARFFFSSPVSCEVHYTTGLELFDWLEVYNKRKRIDEIDKQARAVAVKTYDNIITEYSDNKADFLRQIAKTDKLLEVVKFDRFGVGGRNNYLYSVAMYLRESGLSDDEVRELVLWVNSRGDGLKENEIESTIFRSMRITA